MLRFSEFYMVSIFTDTVLEARPCGSETHKEFCKPVGTVFARGKERGLCSVWRYGGRACSLGDMENVIMVPEMVPFR